jgi:hypothetical protein
MINIPVLKVRRLTVRLRELSIGQAVSLAQIPAHRHEALTTEFLKAAIESSSVENPEDWTVEERMMAVGHYLASTNDAGPDFAVGEGSYSDYLDVRPPVMGLAPDMTLDLGELEGDRWRLRHLTGAHAEAIERLAGELPGIAGRLHWIIGGMAAQLLRAEESQDERLEDAELLERMRVFAGFPESGFVRLLVMYNDGRQKIANIFTTEFSDEGIVALPKKGARGDTLPPARFHGRSCLSAFAQALARTA